MTVYFARKEYVYSGGDAIFSIPFSYIKKEHISVLVNDEATENYTYLNNSQIQVNDALKTNDVVSIIRSTPINSRMVVFSDTSILDKKAQNLAQEQVFDAIQEVYDNNIKFNIDTLNILEVNKEELEQTIANNKQELLDIQSSFESEVNTTIAQNKADTDKQIADFEQEVNTTIETVKEAAEKVNKLEQAVEEAKTAAQTATTKADETQEVLVNAVTEMDSKLATAESSMDSRLSSATATMNEKLSAANIAVENATQQANLATQKAQEIIDINPAKTDLSNLTEAGEKHFLNKSQITNCLLEVPQRIKYTLENGTLTIKAGSVAIVPYKKLAPTMSIGDNFPTEDFKIVDIQYENEQLFYWVEFLQDKTLKAIEATNICNVHLVIETTNSGADISGALTAYYQSKTTSGESNPTSGSGYNTSENYASFNGVGLLSLPLMTINYNSDKVLTDVNQVFNGTGYIGSTVWVDKGVKGLIPNGRNADGSLNNIEWTNDELIIRTFSSGNLTGRLIFDLIGSDYNTHLRYFGSDTYLDNYTNTWMTTGTGIMETGLYLELGNISLKDGIISNFTQKQSFRALDYIAIWYDSSTQTLRIGG